MTGSTPQNNLYDILCFGGWAKKQQKNLKPLDDKHPAGENNEKSQGMGISRRGSSAGLIQSLGDFELRSLQVRLYSLISESSIDGVCIIVFFEQMKDHREWSSSMKKKMFVVLLLGINFTMSVAGVEFDRKIPFDIERNKVILPIRIDGSRPLKIILDSGMPGQGILLFKKELGEELNLEGAAPYRISGAGQGLESTAIRAEAQKLVVGKAEFSHQPVMILQSDTMSGFPSDGVIGNTIFGNHAVRFDFEKKLITLMEPGSFRPDLSWETMAMTFNDLGIPFIQVKISVNGENEIPLHVYIDSASSESLELLVKQDQKFTTPENLETRYLGRGLDGDITGLFGRVARLRLGSFMLEDVPAAFPKAEVRSRQPGAEGIIGNDTLMRFHVVFDFSESKLYLKPNSLYGKPFGQK